MLNSFTSVPLSTYLPKKPHNFRLGHMLEIAKQNNPLCALSEEQTPQKARCPLSTMCKQGQKTNHIETFSSLVVGLQGNRTNRAVWGGSQVPILVDRSKNCCHCSRNLFTLKLGSDGESQYNLPVWFTNLHLTGWLFDGNSASMLQTFARSTNSASWSQTNKAKGEHISRSYRNQTNTQYRKQAPSEFKDLQGHRSLSGKQNLNQMLHPNGIAAPKKKSPQCDAKRQCQRRAQKHKEPAWAP